MLYLQEDHGCKFKSPFAGSKLKRPDCMHSRKPPGPPGQYLLVSHSPSPCNFPSFQSGSASRAWVPTCELSSSSSIPHGHLWYPSSINPGFVLYIYFFNVPGESGCAEFQGKSSWSRLFISPNIPLVVGCPAGEQGKHVEPVFLSII